jgi:hypothetical protein
MSDICPRAPYRYRICVRICVGKAGRRRRRRFWGSVGFQGSNERWEGEIRRDIVAVSNGPSNAGLGRPGNTKVPHTCTRRLELGAVSETKSESLDAQ